MSEIETANSSGVLQTLDYSDRDGVGRILSVDSSRANESWTYTYDGLDQLKTAVNVDNSALSRSYTYGLNGNMLSNSALPGTWTYPSASSPRPHAPTQAGSRAYTGACPRA